MFDEHVSQLIDRFRFAGILVDTNLMLLLVVGRYSTKRIATFKRTSTYSPADFGILMKLLEGFDRIVTTPNIATEVDNLSRQLPKNEHQMLSKAMNLIFATVVEVPKRTTQAVGSPNHARFGLTDAHSIALAAEHLLLTDDFPLYGFTVSRGRPAINFNHLRLA